MPIFGRCAWMVLIRMCDIKSFTHNTAVKIGIDTRLVFPSQIISLICDCHENPSKSNGLNFSAQMKSHLDQAPREEAQMWRQNAS